MRKDYTDIVVVIDRSGSMESVKEDTIGGFNTFLEAQKNVEGKATFTFVQFDDIYELIHNGADIQVIQPLNYETYVPRGWTALNDAICRTINTTGVRLASLSEEERPEKVIFVIITDGKENKSQEFTGADVHRMINHQRENFKWEFVFLGANQDAIATAESLGIDVNNALTFSTSKIGVSSSYDSLSNNITNYRKGGVTGAGFTMEDREKQDEAFKKYQTQ